ncbi:MAG: hypothetical protein ACYCOU_05195 [Sulfobacillus sp.]
MCGDFSYYTFLRDDIGEILARAIVGLFDETSFRSGEFLSDKLFRLVVSQVPQHWRPYLGVGLMIVRAPEELIRAIVGADSAMAQIQKDYDFLMELRRASSEEYRRYRSEYEAKRAIFT